MSHDLTDCAHEARTQRALLPRRDLGPDCFTLVLECDACKAHFAAEYLDTHFYKYGLGPAPKPTNVRAIEPGGVIYSERAVRP